MKELRPSVRSSRHRVRKIRESYSTVLILEENLDTSHPKRKEANGGPTKEQQQDKRCKQRPTRSKADLMLAAQSIPEALTNDNEAIRAIHTPEN